MLVPRPPLPRARAAVGAVLAGVLLVACTGERPDLADDEETTTTVAGATTTTEADANAEVAEVDGRAIDVYADATAADPVQQLTQEQAAAAPDIPIVLLVIGQSDDRLEVRLPTPPVGSTGWVAREDVKVSAVSQRVEIELGAHRIKVLDAGEVVLDEPIAVGQTDRPAPGSYFLKELLQPPDASGPYGTYVYGLAGFTTDLKHFNTGTGIVGIHGTPDPSTLGQDVPAGSIRVHGDVLGRLVNELGLPLGTPVDVAA
ncbi:MAG: L,D-transpeptidase [Acidimicrobiales bacterium]